MDIKNIVEKALKGEDYSVDLKDIPEAEQAGVYVAIKNAAKEEADKEFARKQALKKRNKKLFSISSHLNSLKKLNRNSFPILDLLSKMKQQN